MDRIGEGDRNTRYFHQSVTIRRMSNRILCLRDEVGNEISEPVEIRSHILRFYTMLYSTEQISCPRTDTFVGAHSCLDISYLPSTEEIRAALFSMKPLKAPGPDGFHPIFFLKSWDVVGGCM